VTRTSPFFLNEEKRRIIDSGFKVPTSFLKPMHAGQLRELEGFPFPTPTMHQQRVLACLHSVLLESQLILAVLMRRTRRLKRLLIY
jgi:hypothetical protein